MLAKKSWPTGLVEGNLLNWVKVVIYNRFYIRVYGVHISNEKITINFTNFFLKFLSNNNIRNYFIAFQVISYM